MPSDAIEPPSFSDEIYDESRYTAETRRIMDEHDQRRAAKYLDRPPLVHFKKEIFNNAGVTRCGIVYDVHDKQPTRTTSWSSDVTCPECSPL